MKLNMTKIIPMAALLVTPLCLMADTSGGTLSVTATVDSSISMTFETAGGGISLTGAGTATATLPLGTVSAYESINGSITRTVNGVTDYALATPFGVKVVKANSASSGYDVVAKLDNADGVNVWKVGSTTLSTSDQSVASSQAYGSAISHTLTLTVPHSAAAGGISNSITFTVTSN